MSDPTLPIHQANSHVAQIAGGGGAQIAGNGAKRTAGGGVRRIAARGVTVAAALGMAILLSGCVIVPGGPYHHHYWGY